MGARRAAEEDGKAVAGVGRRDAPHNLSKCAIPLKASLKTDFLGMAGLARETLTFKRMCCIDLLNRYPAAGSHRSSKVYLLEIRGTHTLQIVNRVVC